VVGGLRGIPQRPGKRTVKDKKQGPEGRGQVERKARLHTGSSNPTKPGIKARHAIRKGKVKKKEDYGVGDRGGPGNGSRSTPPR